MSEARARLLRNSTVLFRTGIDRHGAEIIVADITEPGGGRWLNN